MATMNTEERLASLEKKNEELEHRIERSEAVNEIANLMGRYAYHHAAGLDDENFKLFAKRADTRVYFGEQGYWEGPDAADRAWANFVKGTKEEREARRVGSMPIHPNTTPVIVVAGDGKTAKGVWIGVGLLGGKNRETGEPRGAWEWDKYGVDFIKEDGVWKFWHLHIYRLIHGWHVDEKWAEQFSKPEPAQMEGVDGPAVDDNPYRLDTVQRLVPVPPTPYETWDDTFMY